MERVGLVVAVEANSADVRLRAGDLPGGVEKADVPVGTQVWTPE
ncbi:MAG TPA: hypothetical protein VGB76_09760 [Pyrinomonadaceae bacterium]|jgi:hypothetical protein